jgi:aspartate/methionine/tyrosine aminotransferase
MSPIPSSWLADRTRLFDASGIRKVFDLGAKLENPINLSIGQPDFDAPQEAKQAAIEAINDGKNGYALTQGMPVLRDKIQARVDRQLGHDDREAFVTSGTSGGLMLAILAVCNPGDEVIIFDPYFGMYDSLVKVAGAKPVYVDTYPDFQIDLDRVASAISDRTKMILFNSPSNPTGSMANEDAVRALAEMAAERNIVLLSDEIYRDFCYDRPFVSPAKFNPQTLVIDGFSKNLGIPGWRVGFSHGPSDIIHEMIKLQQYSFVCAPHPFQLAVAAAFDVDQTAQIETYRQKRDMIVEGLGDLYELATPAGAFYAFPKSPWGTATEFVERAIVDHSLLIIPGNVFSQKDTHFRISYAADNAVLAQGIKVLREMAQKGE